VGAVVAGIKDIVESTAQYAKQVEDLSRSLGREHGGIVEAAPDHR